MTRVADLPLGIERRWSPTSRSVVRPPSASSWTRSGRRSPSSWRCSIISLGLRPGAVGRGVDSAHDRDHLSDHADVSHIDLQRISLGALIIALSLLVDSAMTTIDVMTTRIAQGDSKEDAASFAYKTLALPMLTGTFVTIAGFVPIGFAQSAAGEYTFSIFAVVTIALIVSWFVAVLFAPLLGVWLLKAAEVAGAGEAQLGRADRSARFLVGAMRVRWITIAVTLACFVAALPGAALRAAPVLPGFRPSRARGRSDPAAERLDLRQRHRRRPSSTPSSRAIPTSQSWSTYVGRGAIRFYLPLDVKLPNDFFSQAVVIAKDVAARDRLQAKLEKTLAEQLPSVVTRVSPLELGPPVGWPVQYRVSGPDLCARCGRSRCSSARCWARPSHLGRSISTGWSRRARFASASTRIRRGCSA